MVFIYRFAILPPEIAWPIRTITFTIYQNAYSFLNYHALFVYVCMCVCVNSKACHYRWQWISFHAILSSFDILAIITDGHLYIYIYIYYKHTHTHTHSHWSTCVSRIRTFILFDVLMSGSCYRFSRPWPIKQELQNDFLVYNKWQSLLGVNGAFVMFCESWTLSGVTSLWTSVALLSVFIAM